MSFWDKIFGNGKNQVQTLSSDSSSSFCWSSQNIPPENNWLAAANNDDCASKTITVYDMSGNAYQLNGEDAKACGGEGIVYSYSKNPDILIKVYKDKTLKNPNKMQEIRQRLLDMSRFSDFSNLNRNSPYKFLAWPLLPVFDAQRQLIGFAMRKCNGVSLRALCGVSSIKKHFPQWDRSDLAKVALDFIEKTKVLSANNVLVNDFNPSNFLVDENRQISFIDCDSFQIPSTNGRVNISKTYFASHVAPELLKNKSLLNCKRNIHHVEFGATMIVFQILMCGLHPYSYYDPFGKTACGNPDENLLNGRCPLGKGSGCRLPQGGWFNLWSYLTGSLKGAFISTFRKEEGYSTPAQRVTLDQMELELRKLLFEMKRDADRCNLQPQVAKPSIDKRNSANNDFF